MYRVLYEQTVSPPTSDRIHTTTYISQLLGLKSSELNEGVNDLAFIIAAVLNEGERERLLSPYARVSPRGRGDVFFPPHSASRIFLTFHTSHVSPLSITTAVVCSIYKDTHHHHQRPVQPVSDARLYSFIYSLIYIYFFF